MMKHWYESCIGVLFSTDEELSYKEMFCNVCEDHDNYIGKFESEVALEALNEELEWFIHKRKYQQTITLKIRSIEMNVLDK